MELRYPVNNSTDIVAIHNPELQDSEQLIFENIFDMNMDGDIYSYQQHNVSDQLVIHFESLTDTERDNLNTFILAHTNEWVRYIEPKNRHRIVKIISPVIETTDNQGDLNTHSILLQVFKDHLEYLTFSISPNINTVTNTPVLSQYTQFLPDLISETNNPILNTASLFEPTISSTTSDPNLNTAAIVESTITSVTNDPLLQNWNIIDVIINTTTTDDLEMFELSVISSGLIELVVDPSGEIDDSYATIQAAIDDSYYLNVPNIFIRNGTYQEEIIIEDDCSHDISGESREGVILNNVTGEHMIYCAIFQGSLKLTNMTIDLSADTLSTFVFAVWLNYSSSTPYQGNIHFEYITFKSYSGDPTDVQGAFSTGRHLDYLTIKDCSFDKASVNTTGFILNKVEVFRNFFTGCRLFFNGSVEIGKVYENTFTNAYVSLFDQMDIYKNTFINTDGTFPYAILYKHQGRIYDNNITITYNDNSYVRGIGWMGGSLATSHDISIYRNIINITTDTIYTAFGVTGGVDLNASVDAENIEIYDNTITINASDTTDTHLGIGLFSYEATTAKMLNPKIMNNIISMWNGADEDIGIHISYRCFDAYLIGNTVNNAGIDIINEGTNTNIDGTAASGLNVTVPDGRFTTSFLNM